MIINNAFNIQLTILENSPSNIQEWDALALQNNNFFQSTFNDPIQSFFRQIPVYFEARIKGKLVGGVKVYLYESTKLGAITAAISRSLSQFSEMLTAFETNSAEFTAMKDSVKKNIQQFIKQKKVTEFTSYGLYGKEELLIELDQQPDYNRLFNSAFVDMNKPIEEVIKGYNRNTNRNIKKAEEAGIAFSEDINIEEFLSALAIIYGQQNPPAHMPNKDFLRHIFKTLNPLGIVDMHFARHNGEIVSSAYFVKYGKTVYSWFGGSVKNQIGAGQFIYYELMKKYYRQGYRNFYFGEVARDTDTENQKFSVGITTFKRGFGLTELPTFKKIYTLSKTKKRLWQLLQKANK